VSRTEAPDRRRPAPEPAPAGTLDARHQPAGVAALRRHNRSLLLADIARHPGRSRAQLAAATGLSRATVSALVDELLADRLLRCGDPTVGRGRPAVPLSLCAEGPAALGVHLDVERSAACVLDLTGTVRACRTERVDNAGLGPSGALRAARRLAASVLDEASLPLAGAAVALPALVDTAGRVRHAPNLPGWAHTDVARALAGRLAGTPVEVGNEANFAALAHRRIEGFPEDFVYVSAGIGVGGAIVSGGRLDPGGHGFAGEIGHVPVERDGPACGCGARGCLEAVAGLRAVLSAAGSADEETLLRRLSAGSARSVTACDAAARALGRAVAAALNLLDVSTVVLGGFYARLGADFSTAVLDEVAPRVASRLPVRVLASPLAADAPVLGAAASVLDALIAAGGQPLGPGRFRPTPSRRSPAP